MSGLKSATVFLGLVTVGMIAGCAAPLTTQSLTRSAVSGVWKVQVTHYSSISCIPSPPPTLEIIQQPKHGELKVANGLVNAGACGRLQGVVISYRSEPDFVGTDTFRYMRDDMANFRHADVTVMVEVSKPN